LIYKRTGKKPQGLAEKPDLPSEAAYVWGLYVEIRAGVESVGIVELDAYQRLTGVNISPWECSVLLQIEGTRKAAA